MKAISIVVLTSILLITVSVLIFIYSGMFDVSAQTPHSRATTWLFTTVREASVKHQASKLMAPDLSDKTYISAGITDYDAMCVSCHGAPGKKPGPIAKGLSPPPPDLQKLVKQRTKEELFWVTKNGIKMTGMPAWGKTHTDDDLWSVVAFLTTLPTLDATSYQQQLEIAKTEGLGHHGSDNSGHDHDRDQSEMAPMSPDKALDHDASQHQGEHHAH